MYIAKDTSVITLKKALCGPKHVGIKKTPTVSVVKNYPFLLVLKTV